MILKIPSENHPAAEFREMTFNKQCKQEGAISVRASDPEYLPVSSAGLQHFLMSRPELSFSSSF